MQFERFTFTLTVILAISMVCQGTTLPAADPPENSSEKSPADSTTEELRELRKEVRRIAESLEELRDSLKNSRTPSQFSPVTIRVQTSDGRPLEGVDVEMETRDGQIWQTVATGTSDGNGLALSRSLPYGTYRIDLTGPTGWSPVRFLVTVEIGRPFELVVNAPDPSDVGVLELTSSLNPAAFGQLRFGELERHEKSKNSHFGYVVPDPGKDLRRFDAYPYVGNGVVEPGVAIQLTVRKSVTQPDGKTRLWSYQPEDGLRHPHLLVTTERIATIEDIRPGVFRPEPESKFFFAEGFNDSYYKAGYLNMKLNTGGDSDRVKRLELPAGDVTIAITKILGRAGPEVEQTIAQYESDEDLPVESPVWLEARLGQDSAWRQRILDFEDWTAGPSYREIATRKLTLAPEETTQLLVASPQNPAPIDDAVEKSSTDSADEGLAADP